MPECRHANEYPSASTTKVLRESTCPFQAEQGTDTAADVLHAVEAGQATRPAGLTEWFYEGLRGLALPAGIQLEDAERSALPAPLDAYSLSDFGIAKKRILRLSESSAASDPELCSQTRPA